jgi:arylsulfatase
VLDVAEQIYPQKFDDRAIAPLAGKSLRPVLESQPREGHESLCWATSGHRAVRVGSWKMVAPPKGTWELYDLSQDRAESHNLADQHPDRVATMVKIFDAWQSK